MLSREVLPALVFFFYAGAVRYYCGNLGDSSGWLSQLAHREAGGPSAPEGVFRASAAVLPRQGRGGQGRLGSVASMAQSRDGENPFPDPGELDNPFQVTCAGLLGQSFFPVPWGRTAIPTRDT